MQAPGREAVDQFRPGLSAVREGSEEAGVDSSSPPPSHAPSMVSPFSAFSNMEPFKRARSLSDEGQQQMPEGSSPVTRVPSTRASSMMPHLAHRVLDSASVNDSAWTPVILCIILSIYCTLEGLSVRDAAATAGSIGPSRAAAASANGECSQR